ncbi:MULTISPECIES: hypothetical protein [Sphingobacterium]|uniref:hypothetical protein n=1 Tax=Sphingobacterium TaxID=28453 RepID=UPI0013DB426A|nr:MULTISPECIES: hypothetical protein [unclassified Sphingobacterium]
MKRFLAVLICMIYTTVSFGGSVYMHHCCGGTSISIYEKAGHDACPLCAKQEEQKPGSEHQKTCSDGKCSDIEIKIDQLANKLFSGQSHFSVHFAPFILTRLWINSKPVASEKEKEKLPLKNSFVCANSSPPTFLLNCIFRI